MVLYSILIVTAIIYYGTQELDDPGKAYGTTDDLTAVGGAMYVGNMDKCLFSPATFTGGLEYQYNALHDIMTGYNRDLKQDVKVASAYAQNEWKMDKFTISSLCWRDSVLTSITLWTM